MSAIVIPSEEDIAVDPSAKERLDQAAREIFTNPPDVNEASDPRVEYNVGTQLAERQAREQSRNAAPTGADEDADLPVELRGKSRAEIARAYVDAHKTIGRNGSELGALRRHAALLEAMAQQPAHRTEAPAPESAGEHEMSDVEFFENPQQAIAKAISTHPLLRGVKGAVEETLHKKSAEQFAKEFPDAEQTMADPAFRQWAAASPVRMKLLAAAHRDFDVEKAREVFGTWRDLKGAASAAKAGTKKVYSRSQLQRLMVERPEEYERRQEEFARAYLENRVR